MADNNSVFKIRHRPSGKFSKGGSRPAFSKTGRVWNGWGPVKLHLQQVSRIDSYKDCEIVECEYVEIRTFDPVSIMLQQRKDKAERERKRKEAYAEWKRKDLERQLRELLPKNGL